LNKLYAVCKDGDVTDACTILKKVQAIFNPNALDGSHMTFLYYGVESGNLAMVDYLVSEHKIDVNQKIKGYNEGTALMKAVSLGHLDIITYFIQDCGADIAIKNNKGNNLLYFAVQHGKSDLFKFLLTMIPETAINDANDKGLTCLLEACRLGHAEIVSTLLEYEGYLYAVH